MTISLRELAIQCESAIRRGSIAEARMLLEEVNVAQVPREERRVLANFCRRTGLVKKGLRLLTPIVHATLGAGQARATEAELAEYAVLLQRSGVVHEAVSILEAIPPTAFPEVELYRAYCHFNLWQYEKALPLLESFVNTRDKDYLHLIGRVNLAAAHISLESFSNAKVLIQDILAEKDLPARLMANCFEMQAQVELSNLELSAARVSLEKAYGVLKSAGTLDELFIQKWLAAIESREQGSVLPLQKYRASALSAGDGDSVREADRNMLDVQFDSSLFDYLVFGSPYEEYQKKLILKFDRPPQAALVFIGYPDKLALNIATGVVTGGNCELEIGSQSHMVLSILFRDFYRPLNIGGIFSELFLDERFNIDSSPLRVQQAIHRTREWVAKAQLPLQIVERDGYYLPLVGEGLGIGVELERGKVDWQSVQFRRLKSIFHSSQFFKAKDAREKLGLAEGVFKRLAAALIAEGKIEQTGKSASTRYRVKAMA